MARLSLAPILNLFLVAPCPLCERQGQPLLCGDCQQQLQDCRTSQTSSSQDNSQPYPVIAWGTYQGPLKRAIAQLKYHHTPALAEPLGQGLAEAWLRSQPNQHQPKFHSAQRPWVIPVPMHPSKQQQRGFNQAELIARSFCRHTGLPLLAQGLQRTQATEAQFKLSPAERQRNVAQAFELGPALKKQCKNQHKDQRPVVLLDDIYTTGATVEAIAQVLAAAQIPLSAVAVVARAVQ